MPGIQVTVDQSGESVESPESGPRFRVELPFDDPVRYRLQGDLGSVGNGYGLDMSRRDQVLCA